MNTYTYWIKRVFELENNNFIASEETIKKIKESYLRISKNLQDDIDKLHKKLNSIDNLALDDIKAYEYRENLVNNLKAKIYEEYKNLLFDFKEDDEFQFYLLYKDKLKKDYMISDNDDITEEIDSIFEKYLNDEELEELVIVYDYLNEIRLNEISLIDKQVYRKSKNIKISDEYIGNLNNDYKEMENELCVA